MAALAAGHWPIAVTTSRPPAPAATAAVTSTATASHHQPPPATTSPSPSTHTELKPAPVRQPAFSAEPHRLACTPECAAGYAARPLAARTGGSRAVTRWFTPAALHARRICGTQCDSGVTGRAGRRRVIGRRSGFRNVRRIFWLCPVGCFIRAGSSLGGLLCRKCFAVVSGFCRSGSVQRGLIATACVSQTDSLSPQMSDWFGGLVLLPCHFRRDEI